MVIQSFSILNEVQHQYSVVISHFKLDVAPLTARHSAVMADPVGWSMACTLGDSSRANGNNITWFREELHSLLENGGQDLIGWHPINGIKVTEFDRFTREIAAPHFGCLTWESFLELLAENGFIATQQGGEQVIFTHPVFRRESFLHKPSDVGGSGKSGKRQRENSSKSRSPSSRPHARRKVGAEFWTWVPPPSCAACGRDTGARESCTMCGLQYHLRCLDPPRASLSEAGWVCNACQPTPRALTSSSPSLSEKRAPSKVLSSILARLSTVSPEVTVLPEGGAQPMTDQVVTPRIARRQSMSGGSEVTNRILAWALQRSAAVPTKQVIRGDHDEDDVAHVDCSECCRGFNLNLERSPPNHSDSGGRDCSKCSSRVSLAAADSPANVFADTAQQAGATEEVLSESAMEKGRSAYEMRGFCVACSRRGDKTLGCSSCTARYHRRCMKPPPGKGEIRDWQCERCVLPAKPRQVAPSPGLVFTCHPSGWSGVTSPEPRSRTVLKANEFCSVPLCKANDTGLRKIGSCSGCNRVLHLCCMDPPRQSLPDERNPFFCRVCQPRDTAAAAVQEDPSDSSSIPSKQLSSTPSNEPSHPPPEVLESCSAPVCKVNMPTKNSRVGKVATPRSKQVGSCSVCNLLLHLCCMDPPRRVIPKKSNPYRCVACRDSSAFPKSTKKGPSSLSQSRSARKAREPCSAPACKVGKSERRQVGSCSACKHVFHLCCMDPPRRVVPKEKNPYHCGACRDST